MESVLLNRGLYGGRLILFESLPSTNQWMIDHIRSCGHGDVVRAQSQTAGRGRFHRPWVTPAGRCLTLSVLLRFDTPDEWLAPVIGQAAALAVRATLAEHRLPAVLKWPNDVLVRERKIAGILAEKLPGSDGLVLGIGLNVNLTGEDLAALRLDQPATSMLIETERESDIGTVCADFLRALGAILDRARQKGMSHLLENWRLHDALAGKHIDVTTGTAMLSGSYAGLDESGRLCLVDDAGQTHFFWAGDVSIRSAAGT